MFLIALAVAAMIDTQDAGAPAVVPQTTTVAEPAPAPPQAASWKRFSGSSIRAYLLDIHGVKRDGDVAGGVVAQVPLTVADHSYTLIDIEIQCATHQSRVIAETPFDAAGVAQDREDVGESFAPYAAGGMDAAVATLLCENKEPTGDAYASVVAYIDAGRR